MVFSFYIWEGGDFLNNVVEKIILFKEYDCLLKELFFNCGMNECCFFLFELLFLI